MILVTGATGQLGSAVVRRLLERTAGADIAALARDESKAGDLAARGVSVRVGDYDDTAALDRAMAGVDRVLLIAGNTPQRRVQQHQNVIDAARRAGVGLIGFASRSLRDIQASENTLMHDYFETEDRIRCSGLPHVLFRDALYLDTVPHYVGGPRVFETGIRLPAGDGKVAYALRREMGEALANAMLDHEGADRTYVVAASRGYTFDDVAAALTEVSGRTVDYTRISDEEYVADAARAGLPEHLARRFLGFFSDIRSNQLDETSSDLETLLGRAPTRLPEGLRELFGLSRSNTR
ncbi:NADPH:quinone oxidoreductase 2 [Cystobacter fuscus DSM 2262]|uniref:NADPH:quinone oxidoreductase 2 n=1 Tax=Cystobacter fuscus (strain ATCC 25194 / DSM 2262 / NBRC 100088 / M29) TaxID=1242864 RepID=S9PJW0_CYSF2|nr:SDR family oxidoreductase [Cystobacter fuscus]EPX64555.1 NADPH:quinone oxidoreductase 2 [Cystobacter fuscus DSM 2262]